MRESGSKRKAYTGLGRVFGIPKVEYPRISRKSAHEGSKVVSPKHWPPLLPNKYSWNSFLLKVESTPGSNCGRNDYFN